MDTNRRLSISPAFYLVWTLMLLTVSAQWLFPVVIAALVHEVFHLLAMVLLGNPAERIRLDWNAARIVMPGMGRGKELCCALAGPLGSFLLLFFIHSAPKTAICGLIQGIFNLLPVYPLDGGRALWCLLHLCLPPPLAEKIHRLAETIILVSLFLLSFFAVFVLKWGFFPIYLPGILFIQKISGKIPCITRPLGVK